MIFLPTNFTLKIYEVVRQIPKGCVASYGQIAMLAGNPHGARG
ncbi:MAG: MGMT family protein, partial [Ruthenibacterium sp.]